MAVRLDVWVDNNNQGLCDRVHSALAFGPPELGVRLIAAAITADDQYRNFVANVLYPEFIVSLQQKMGEVEGLWINEYPPGVEAQIKDGSIWNGTDAPGDLTQH